MLSLSSTKANDDANVGLPFVILFNKVAFNSIKCYMTTTAAYGNLRKGLCYHFFLSITRKNTQKIQHNNKKYIIYDMGTSKHLINKIMLPV